MKIARCTPSRGLVHSRTEQVAEEARIWAEAHGHEWRNFWSHDRPIPDCFNAVCAAGYAWGADLFWLLEEDMQPSFDALPEMLGAITMQGADVAVVDYVMDMQDKDAITWGVQRAGPGRIAWTRTGCILFKRECLEALPRPWFTTAGRLFKADGTYQEWPDVYGYGADVGFTHSLVQLGFKFVEVDARCDHLRIIERGGRRNAGWHQIEALPEPPKPTIAPPRRKHHGSIGR